MQDILVKIVFFFTFRTIRLSYEPGQWRTLPQTVLSMYRSLNLRINSMWSLLVSFSRFQTCSNLWMYYYMYFYKKKTFTELFINSKVLNFMADMCFVCVCGLCIRSCGVWRRIQVCHAGSELRVSSHVHTGYTPGPHFTWTVSRSVAVWISSSQAFFFSSNSSYFN